MYILESIGNLFRAMLGKTGDTSFQVPRLDVITHTLQVIDYAHHEIHGGSSFTAHYSLTTAATDAHRTGLFIKTPATGKLCHLIVSFGASAAATFKICEAPTIAANIGSHAAVIYNRYRDSSTSSGCLDNATTPAAGKFTTLTEAQIAGDVTWAEGTVIRSATMQAGVGPKPAGGESRDAQEYILKANTKYVFLITNVGANANTHNILVDWYEHANKQA